MKHFILSIALGLALVSCGRDNDDNATAETPILPIKIVDGDDIQEFKYNGNKLTEIITKDGGLTRGVVEYSGDFITSITKYDKEIGGNQIGKIIYTYTGGKLTEEKNIDIENGKTNTNITVYKYNNDGTLTATSFDSDTPNNVRTSKITFINGNLVKSIVNNDFIHYYKFDTKNNPFKNIKGISALVVSGGAMNANNPIEMIETTLAGDYSYTETYSYEYNTNGFPVKRVITSSVDGGQSITTYTYNK